MNIIILLENMKGRVHFGDLYVDGRIILKFIFEKYCETMLIGFTWLRVETNGGRGCEHRNELSGS
jgi:hypothetical protein